MSKRKSFLSGIVVILTTVFLIGGCSFFHEIAEKNSLGTEGYTSLKESIPVESLQSNTAKAMWHKINATEEAIATLEKYVDIPEVGAARKAGGSPLDMEAIGKYLPSDLTTLKRSINEQELQSRSVEGQDIPEDGAISLQNELDAIIATFSEEMDLLVPTLNEEALTDYCYIEDGLIYLAGGISYPQRSMEGIAIAEVLTAVERGEDPEAAALRISEEIEQMVSSGISDQARGIFINITPRWPFGIVEYMFNENVDDFYKRTIRKAMDAWEEGSNRKVKFNEYKANGWNDFLLVTASKFVLRIEKRSESSSNRGEAWLGAAPWTVSYMYLYDKNLDLLDTPGKKTVFSVALHELGHVLGLQHEHQRYDRDDYLIVANSVGDQAKIPEILLPVINFDLTWKSKKILGVTIWYLEIKAYTTWFDTNSIATKTAFDFDSIMLYPDIEIKRAQDKNTSKARQDGTIWYTRRLGVLSPNDKAFIRTLY
jgi:hypothetical protein